jgi:hypothetical protein
MNAIKGTFKNGQIVLDEPADWPGGSRVLVEPVQEEETMGIREQDWPATPDQIARHLSLMDQIEPLTMTTEEEAEWQSARNEQKEFEKAGFAERAKRIETMFK